MNYEKIHFPPVTCLLPKTLLLFYILWATVPSSLGQVLSTSEGETTFYAKAPAPATDVNAINKKTKVSINKETGQVSVKINMKDFTLPKTLMQKHYNEKYMETDKFPVSTFEGKMNSVPDFTKNGTYDVTATGNLLVHGVTKKRTITGKITVKDGTLTLSSEFEVKLADHNVTIPVIFFMKITESVKVKTTYVFKG
jgi:polyisoprenoid-binding protein YceI